MAFTNASIFAPRKHKPHICVRQGWWRVSKYRKPYAIERQDQWQKAHEFAHHLNNHETIRFPMNHPELGHVIGIITRRKEHAVEQDIAGSLDWLGPELQYAGLEAGTCVREAYELPTLALPDLRWRAGCVHSLWASGSGTGGLVPRHPAKQAW